MHKQNLLRTVAWRVSTSTSNADSWGMAHLGVVILDDLSLAVMAGVLWRVGQCGRIFIYLHGYPQNGIDLQVYLMHEQILIRTVSWRVSTSHFYLLGFWLCSLHFPLLYCRLPLEYYLCHHHGLPGGLPWLGGGWVGWHQEIIWSHPEARYASSQHRDHWRVISWMNSH